jgi:hypothetical protein
MYPDEALARRLQVRTTLGWHCLLILEHRAQSDFLAQLTYDCYDCCHRISAHLQAQEFAMSTSDTSQFNLEGTVDIVLRVRLLLHMMNNG